VIYWLLQASVKSNELEQLGPTPVAPLPAFKSGRNPAKAAVERITKAMIKIVRMTQHRTFEQQPK
jgi:hypothetical protein